MHCQPVYRRGEVQSSKFQVSGDEAICQTSGSSVAYINGVSEALFKVGMCLPAGPYVSDDDVKYIVDTIKENIIG
jgi:dTDP-4-amino-4,6-dideoxygalactose transaminase